MKVQIYADIVCPWCYIGALRFKRSLHSFSDPGSIELTYQPFQLDPEALDEPEPLERHLRRKYGRHAPEMMEAATLAAHEEGVIFRLERAVAVSTFAAHRLLDYVLRKEGAPAQVELVNRLYGAYFEAGANIADADVLAGIGAETGLDEREIRAFLESEEYVDELRVALDAGRRRGITAVPTFVFDETYAIQGAQPPAVFVQALNRLVTEAT